MIRQRLPRVQALARSAMKQDKPMKTASGRTHHRSLLLVCPNPPPLRGTSMDDMETRLRSCLGQTLAISRKRGNNQLPGAIEEPVSVNTAFRGKVSSRGWSAILIERRSARWRAPPGGQRRPPGRRKRGLPSLPRPGFVPPSRPHFSMFPGRIGKNSPFDRLDSRCPTTY